MRRVSPLCAAFRADCECVRGSSAKAHVAPTCGQRGKTQIQNAEKPRRGGKNPPVWEEPASRLSGLRQRRCPPSAQFWAEAQTHFINDRRRYEKRHQIQHPHGIRRPRKNPGIGAKSRYVHERLCDRLLPWQAHRHHGQSERSPAAAKAIGNNLNQLSVLANMGKVQFANLDTAAQEFAKINVTLREMQEGVSRKSQLSIS